jgi:NADH:ubiquinone oxidoreductase subunit K
MIDLPILLHKLTLILGGAIFVAGVSTIFLRRIASWILMGQVFALKAVAACAFLLSQLSLHGGGDLIVVSLVTLGLVPSLSVVGMLVLHRCGRFGGSLDVDQETMLRH